MSALHNDRKTFGIHGGVHPPENKIQSTSEAIGSIPLADELVLPLNQHIGAMAIPAVEVGENVLKGQLIADADGIFSATLHASTSGSITAIEEREIPHPSGMMAECIVITPDGKDEWIELNDCENYTDLDHQQLVAKIRAAGIVGMGGAGFPTAVKVNPRADNPVQTLILNGTECEPYITADDMLMRERPDEVVAGAKLLAKLLNNPEEVLIGIEDNKPEAIAAMRKAAEHSAVEIVVFPTKYPSGGEKQLIEIITGKQVPSGGIPAQIGIVVQNVATAVAAYRAVRFGEPLVSRVTTVVGDSLLHQRNIDVPLGTPIAHILSAHGWRQEESDRLIIGGPMMGFTLKCSDAPVTKTTNCILAPSITEMPAPPPAQACIRCGMCAEACPANLLPQQLFWYSRSENYDQLREHNLFDCIECGACSFVCPSNIPLVQYYRASKGEIRQLDGEKEKSDRARLRFEARQERIARADAEKEAKRLARKEAAEKAKKLQAEKTATAPEKDIVKEAVDTAQSKEVDPAKEKAKFERAVSSANSRVERAKASLETSNTEGADEARIESLKARLKQAELKAGEAEIKLKEFEKQLSAIENTSKAVAEKITTSPREKIEKSIVTIEKRIATAKEKLAEAQAANTPTAGALQQGVEKLEQKLATNQQELAQLNAEIESSETEDKEAQKDSSPGVDVDVDVAKAAIEKAKAKAAIQAAMSPEEKMMEQIKSLQVRLDKARTRLQNAQNENNENIDAFEAGVAKLETKLAQAQATLTEGNI